MMSSVTPAKIFSYEDFSKNFPFPTIHPKQYDVLKQICDAINSGFKYIVLEAPTGFGKSPVAVTIARTLGSSYICSATKELQTQYVKDFPYLKPVKGMGNYSCLVKEDFIENKTYACNRCEKSVEQMDNNNNNIVLSTANCKHKSVEYGPCRTQQNDYKHDSKKCQRCIGLRKGYKYVTEFHDGCRYRTFIGDYELKFGNTEDEQVEMSETRRGEYEDSLGTKDKNSNNRWAHYGKFEDFEKIRKVFTPCPYFDQLNKGLIASHSIFNYANFLLFQRLKSDFLPRRELLVLDEGHSIENHIIERIGFSISKKTLQRFIKADIFDNANYSYEDSIEKTWLVFLDAVHSRLLNLLEDIQPEELRLEADEYLKNLKQMILEIKSDPLNWIVSKIEKASNNNNKIIRVEFKPIDVSSYCRKLFDKCNITFIMSATILDIDTFCRNIGLDIREVKFINVDSDFPINNRPIYQKNIARLNFESLQLETVQQEIAWAVDNLMSIHESEKGIIHCTSYAQVNFIQKYMNTSNKKRLLLTDPERSDGRDSAISDHFTNHMPTVLISPSLHTGLDLKDDSSRFQIVVKVPYPNRQDRWIEAKRKQDLRWYNWQTSIKLVQAYGRSVRSKDDWANTYVLDTGFKYFISRNRLPKWYTEAIVV